MKKTLRILTIMTALLLAVCMITPCFSAYVPTTERLLGDVDNDGSVTVVDVTVIQRTLASLMTIDKAAEQAADVDGDGEMLIIDATLIQRWLASLSVRYPINEPMNLYRTQEEAAIRELRSRLDAYRTQVYVYRDNNSADNHFTQRARMTNSPGNYWGPDHNWTDHPYSGDSCIRCSQCTVNGSWGGWLFLNGYQKKGADPQLNTGAAPGQGMNLTGAKELRFFARGEKGGETAEFYTAGFTNGDYPDSTGKQSLGEITLTDQWKEYVLDISNADMSYTVNGFAYVTNDRMNGYNNEDVVFYLDDIRFTGEIESAVNAPDLLRSYDTDKKELSQTAYTYDNALVAMAFMSENDQSHAKSILDAFVFAVNNDRYQSGRIRNAYLAGDITPFPGWETGARIPGFIGNNGAWAEDAYQAGSNVGNTSYVVLAMLQYDAKYGENRYLSTAETLMDWVLSECTDGSDGFTGGYDGWPEKGKDYVTKHAYKSLEHNIDAYAAFKRLYTLTGKEKYGDAADSALRFIRSMFNEDEGWFYTGTNPNGSINTDVVVLDTQVWSAMALGDLYDPYTDALQLVDSMKLDGGGYPFCVENKNGGWWAEGTAFTALMYADRGDREKFTVAMNTLCTIQRKNGLFPAATVDNLSTGIYLSDGSPWEYGTASHIAPTAWFVMAANGFNPYTF